MAIATYSMDIRDYGRRHGIRNSESRSTATSALGQRVVFDIERGYGHKPDQYQDK
jgi:hypothetical protein